MKRRRISRFFKRTLDVTAGAALLVALSPILLFVAVLIRVKLGSPILFCQKRPGLHGTPFLMLKFRTMTDCRDGQGELAPDEQRLTQLGKFLRKTSLDELPELVNVLRGEMSLVGPRPLLVEYLDRYTPEQARRHEVRPGITGWAQVNGRNAIGWEKRFKMDAWYIDNWSFWLDGRILLLTVWKVAARNDISASSHATMPEFTGKGENSTDLGSHGAQHL